MNVYSISGFDIKGKFHFFYVEAKNLIEACNWVKIMGYNYLPKTQVELACEGGYENLFDEKHKDKALSLAWRR